MTDRVIQPEDGEEQMANSNLSIGVGVLGMGSFVLLYVLFFAVTTMKPRLIFKLVPFPSITDAVLSDGNRTYLLSQQIDMSTIDPRQKREPGVKHFISLLVGTGPEASQEIPPYAHASGADNRLLFLSKGSYRIYDGSRWVEERSDAIGQHPRGLLAPAGVYVLSGSGSGHHLSLIAAGTIVDVPLPADYLAW